MMKDLVKRMNDEEELIEEDEDWMPDECYAMVEHKDELLTKENTPSYAIIYASKLEEGEVPLGKVVGHENQKKEILSV